MNISFDSDSSVSKERCPNCGQKYIHVVRYVYVNSEPNWIILIDCHNHDGPEVYITGILGDFSLDEVDYSKNQTFICRYGLLEDQYVCSLVDSECEDEIYGKVLTRKQALKHPKINEYWDVVDFVLENDMTIHKHLYHQKPSLISRIKSVIRRDERTIISSQNIEFINNLNLVLLASDDKEVLSQVSNEQIEQYYDAIRETFKEAINELMTSKDDTLRKELFLEMCKLNGLYAIQLKLGQELPEDMEEIAYDFDNPDYPGLNYIVEKIENKTYKFMS